MSDKATLRRLLREHSEANRTEKMMIAEDAIIKLFDVVQNEPHLEIERLRARAERAEARLSEYQDDAARVLSEQCPTDEQHCGCVPILRKEIARLNEERRWIDPKVEMPNDRDDPVDENGYGESRSHYWGEFLHKNGYLSYGEVAYNYSRGRWEVCDEGIWGRVNVNHYHLLPEPPEASHD